MPTVMKKNSFEPSLLPYLFPNEFHEEICKNMKGQSKKNTMAYIVWQKKDIRVIQANLLDGFANELNSLFYSDPECLIELFEWVIDTSSEDDFAYVECVRKLTNLSCSEIYSLTADFVEQQMLQSVRIRRNVEKVLSGVITPDEAINMPTARDKGALKEHLKRFKKTQLIVEKFLSLIC